MIEYGEDKAAYKSTWYVHDRNGDILQTGGVKFNGQASVLYHRNDRNTKLESGTNTAMLSKVLELSTCTNTRTLTPA